MFLTASLIDAACAVSMLLERQVWVLEEEDVEDQEGICLLALAFKPRKNRELLGRAIGECWFPEEH